MTNMFSILFFFACNNNVGHFGLFYLLRLRCWLPSVCWFSEAIPFIIDKNRKAVKIIGGIPRRLAMIGMTCFVFPKFKRDSTLWQDMSNEWRRHSVCDSPWAVCEILFRLHRTSVAFPIAQFFLAVTFPCYLITSSREIQMAFFKKIYFQMFWQPTNLLPTENYFNFPFAFVLFSSRSQKSRWPNKKRNKTKIIIIWWRDYVHKEIGQLFLFYSGDRFDWSISKILPRGELQQLHHDEFFGG